MTSMRFSTFELIESLIVILARAFILLIKFAALSSCRRVRFDCISFIKIVILRVLNLILRAFFIIALNRHNCKTCFINVSKFILISSSSFKSCFIENSLLKISDNLWRNHALLKLNWIFSTSYRDLEMTEYWRQYWDIFLTNERCLFLKNSK